MDEERLIVSLEARIRDFERNMKKAERTGTQSYAQLRRASRTSSSTMERDMVRSTTRINQALATTSSRIGSFGKAFAAAAVAAGLAAITRGATQAIRGMAEIGQQARRAGLSVQAFQELKFVSEQSRIGVDAMIDGLKELQLRADEFIVTGAGPAAEAFNRLGLSATNLKKGLEDPEDLLLDIIDRLEDLDRAAQIRISDEIFGGTAGERFVELLAHGDEGIRTMMNRANDLGLVMDAQAIAKAEELDRKFAEITTRVSNLGKTIVVNVGGALQDALTVDIDEIFGSAERAIAMMGEANYRALQDVQNVTEDQRATVEDLVETYEELFRAINAATGPDGIRLMDVADIDAAHELAAILQDIEAEMQAFQTGASNATDFEAAVTDLVGEAQDLVAELDAVDAQRFGGVIGALGRIANALNKAATQAANLRVNLPEGDTATNLTYGPPRRGSVRPPSANAPRSSPRPRAAPGNPDFGMPAVVTAPAAGGGGGGGTARTPFADEVEQTRERIALLEAEAAALVAVAASGREYGDAVEYARKRAELLTKAKEEGREITPELRAEIDQLAAAYTTAGAAADEAADRLERIQDAAEEGVDRMTDLFTSIIDGSMDAREALSRLLMELAKVQIQKAFIGLSETSGGGGFFKAVGELLGFERGGYTGHGGRMEPAGVVHRGEYVVQANQVRRPGVRPLLEAINSGLPGFASGGPVPGGQLIAPASARSDSQQSTARTGDVHIHHNWNIAANGDDSVKRIVRQQAPAIVEASKNAVLDAKRRGGSYGRAF